MIIKYRKGTHRQKIFLSLLGSGMKFLYSLFLFFCLAFGTFSFATANVTDRLCYCFQTNISNLAVYKIVGSYPASDCAGCIAEDCVLLYGGQTNYTLPLCSYNGVTVVSDIETYLGEVETTIADEITGDVSVVENYVLKQLQTQTTEIETYISTLLRYLNDTLETFRHEVESNFTYIEQELQVINVTSISQEISEAVTEIDDDIKEAVSELEAYVKKYADNIEVNVTEQFSNVEQDIEKINITLVLDEIKKYAEMIEVNVTEQFDSVEQDIEKINITLVSEVNQAVDFLEAYFKEYSEKIEVNVTDEIKKYAKNIEANVTDELNILEENMITEFFNSLKTVNISLDDVDDKILNLIKNISEELKAQRNITVKVDDVLKEMLNINLNISLEQPTPPRKPVCNYQQPPCPYGPSCQMYQPVSW